MFFPSRAISQPRCLRQSDPLPEIPTPLNRAGGELAIYLRTALNRTVSTANPQSRGSKIHSLPDRNTSLASLRLSRLRVDSKSSYVPHRESLMSGFHCHTCPV